MNIFSNCAPSRFVRLTKRLYYWCVCDFFTCKDKRKSIKLGVFFYILLKFENFESIWKTLVKLLDCIMITTFWNKLYYIYNLWHQTHLLGSLFIDLFICLFYLCVSDSKCIAFFEYCCAIAVRSKTWKTYVVQCACNVPVFQVILKWLVTKFCYKNVFRANWSKWDYCLKVNTALKLKSESVWQYIRHTFYANTYMHIVAMMYEMCAYHNATIRMNDYENKLLDTAICR